MLNPLDECLTNQKSYNINAPETNGKNVFSLLSNEFHSVCVCTVKMNRNNMKVKERQQQQKTNMKKKKTLIKTIMDMWNFFFSIENDCDEKTNSTNTQTNCGGERKEEEAKAEEREKSNRLKWAELVKCVSVCGCSILQRPKVANDE